MIPHQDYPTCDLLNDSRNYYGLKRTPIERALVAASGMGPPDARSVLMLICQAGIKGGGVNATVVREPGSTLAAPIVQSEGAAHYARREKIIKRTKAACDRVIDYAKHETLRKVEKYFRDNPIASGNLRQGSDAESGVTASETDITGPKDDANASHAQTLAEQLAFKKQRFSEEMAAVLREEATVALA